jgi:hypothetical protein
VQSASSSATPSLAAHAGADLELALDMGIAGLAHGVEA